MIGYEWNVVGNNEVYHIEGLAKLQKGFWKLEIDFN